MNEPDCNQYPSTCPLAPEVQEKTRIVRDKLEEEKAPVGKQELPQPITTDDFLNMTEERMVQINRELRLAFETIAEFPKTVTFYGSARLEKESYYYEKARRLARVCAKHGFAVVSGGGPGIMQAANQGSYEESGVGIGFNIVLPFEQKANPYVTHGVDFEYFFTRKFSMNFTGEAYLCFPGGFGTLDEFFEVLTLVQTKKIQQIPIILVGSDFWQPLMDYIIGTLRDEFKTISPEDLDLFQIMDDESEIMKVLDNAPIRDGYYH
ncbi:MAG: TIGR00730 family Rossman fold protein [Patescibacteria group bacterium]